MNDKRFKAVLVLFMLAALFISGCKKSADLLLTISYSQWSLVHETNGADTIYLKLSGSTQGERVTVKTYGDGLINEYELLLNANKEFDSTVSIAFSHQRYSLPVKISTVVTAVVNGESVAVTLESGNLY